MSLLWIKASNDDEWGEYHDPQFDGPGGGNPPSNNRAKGCGYLADGQKRAIQEAVARQRNQGWMRHEYGSGECPDEDEDGFCPGHEAHGYHCSECNTQHVLKPEDIRVEEPGEHYGCSWRKPHPETGSHYVFPEHGDSYECTQQGLHEHPDERDSRFPHVGVNYGAAHHPDPSHPAHDWGALYGLTGEGLELWAD